MKKIIALILLLTLTLLTFASCKSTPPESIGSVSLISEADHDAVAAKMLTGDIDIAILPEPKATASINAAKAEGHNYSVKLNISNEWSNVSDNELAMGCIVVSKDYADKYEASLAKFLDDYKASIEFIGDKNNAETSAQLIVDAKILPKLPIAKAALSNLDGAIVYSDGDKMKTTLESFYDAIGLGKPDTDFYYAKSSSPNGTKDKTVIGVMNGPTGMGMAKLISEKKAEYEFRMYSDPSLATADLASGEIDMACLPTNTAASLYTKGAKLEVAAINCLGSLYVVVKDGVDVTDIKSLVGKTVYYGVPNSTTAPIITYILKQNNIAVEKNGDK